MKQIDFWTRKFYRRALQLFASHFYLNPDRDLRKCILVAGTARSGTTWLGDIIASQIPCRILFEPFNPNLVPEYRGFHYFQYLQPGAKNPEFRTFAQKVFSGEIRNRWIDRQNERIFSKYRLIKEIRANLALKWLHDNFPQVPIIFLIRHPCAVVASRMDLGWATDDDIAPFLSQPALVADYLAPQMDLIANARTPEEKHAIIWSVSNLVPLRQFPPAELKIVYYENLCTQPEIEVSELFKTIGKNYGSSLFNAVDRPSQTARENSAVTQGVDRVSHWKKKLTSSQIDKIFRVVDAFGLDYLYSKSTLPLNQNVA